MGGIVLIILLKLGVNTYVAIGLLLIFIFIIEAFLGKGTFFGHSKREDSDEDSYEDEDVGFDGDD